MIRAAIVLLFLSGVAHAKPKAKPAPGPEPMHRAAIPDGDGWWCWVKPDAGLSGCMRSESKCGQLESAMGSLAGASSTDQPCTKTARVWVRTGMRGDEWRYHAAPSKELCEQQPGWNSGLFQHASGCERWHESESPPDPADVPAGKGWSCYAAGATSICARTQAWCDVAYRISHGDGSASTCREAARAFVFTTTRIGELHAFGDAAACEAARDDDETASTCAAIK